MLTVSLAVVKLQTWERNSDALIIGLVVGIGPIMDFLGSIGIGKFYQ